MKSARCLQEPTDLKAQLWQVSLNNAPDDFGGDGGVGMDQAIAESDESTRVRNLVSHAGIQFDGLVQCLANDSNWRSTAERRSASR